MIRYAALLFCFVSLSPQTRAQFLDCNVKVNYEAVSNTHKDLLRNFQQDVTDYVNAYKWGDDMLDDKVRCTMDIFIQSATGENRYMAQVFIGSKRLVNGSDRSTAVVRLFDESWEFTYVESRPLNHNLYAFNDVASFLDFYAYIILGHDYDTYEPSGGTPYFQKAADLASLGRNSGAKGWERKTGSYSRLQIIEEVLNPKFAPARAAMYTYHYRGLDSLAVNAMRARSNVFQALETIGKVSREVNPRNLYIKAFFEAKYLEVAEVFTGHHDPSVYSRLALIDPSHQTTYEEYLNRKK